MQKDQTSPKMKTLESPSVVAFFIERHCYSTTYKVVRLHQRIFHNLTVKSRVLLYKKKLICN
jgi:hypothetical protein